ncbi:MAG: hypothetical protein ACI8W8_002049 [Rhodothermales bacterium]|jgi:hypothetical protein
MATPEKFQQFLDTAASGLGDDEELRLEIRAELAAHMDESVEELAASELDEEAQQGEALKRFGPAVDLANDLVEANRSRMKARARLRIALQVATIPLALAAIIYCIASDLGHVRAMSTLKLGGDIFMDPSSIGDGLSAEEELIVVGSSKEILAANPDNLVFLNNHLTTLLGSDQTDEILALTAEATLRDPDNARYAYIDAFILLQRAVDLEDATTAKTPLVIKDREVLDQAMATLQLALSKDEFRRYASGTHGDTGPAADHGGARSHDCHSGVYFAARPKSPAHPDASCCALR